jgi:NADH-quinone oxidoreductase subunit N
VNAGQIWLAVAAVILSLIGAFYYLRVVKLMYFDDPLETTRVTGAAGFRLALSTNGLALLFFGILPQPLMNACLEAIKASF